MGLPLGVRDECYAAILFFVGNEFQDIAINTVAFARWGWAIIKNMP
jgi:hypothetical protein